MFPRPPSPPFPQHRLVVPTFLLSYFSAASACPPHRLLPSSAVPLDFKLSTAFGNAVSISNSSGHQLIGKQTYDSAKSAEKNSESFAKLFRGSIEKVLIGSPQERESGGDRVKEGSEIPATVEEAQKHNIKFKPRQGDRLFLHLVLQLWLRDFRRIRHREDFFLKLVMKVKSIYGRKLPPKTFHQAECAIFAH
eukprot:768459-Hanusia_phi.AAC.13